MFFNSGAGAASFGTAVSANLRAGLLAGTILGAGALVLLPGAGQAADYVYTGPASTGTAVTSTISGMVTVTGTDKVTITTTAGGTVTAAANGYNNGAVVALSGDGDIALNLGDTVRNTATGTIVFARSVGAGSISLTGAGNFIGNAYGLRAETDTGAITLGGTGSVLAGNSGGAVGILAWIGSAAATSDILINRSGAITGFNGVDATNNGSGKITIQGIGAVTATSNGINSSAASGATLIDLTNNVTATATNTAGAAVQAASTTGDITIKTASGVAISSDTTGISAASSAGGNIVIGDTAGLGGAVSGRDNGAINATTTGNGAIAVKTAAGGNITGGLQYAIKTTAVDGATTISIGSGSTTTGLIDATSNIGNVTVNNAGVVRGALAYTGGGRATFNNSGTLIVADAQGSVGFNINNTSGGVLTGDSTGSLGTVTATAGSIIRPGNRTLDVATGGVPVMGTLNVFDLNLAAGALVEVRVDASGVSDKIVAGNRIILGGATLKVLATPQTSADWATSKTFTVMTGPVVTGTFASTIQTDYAFLKFTAAYDGSSVKVTGERGWTSFGAYSSTPNQKSVSDVFDKFQTQASNPLIAKVTTLTVAQAPVAMAQLSGTGLAAARTQSFSASGMFNGAVNAEMGKFTGSAGGGAVLSYAPEKKVTKAFDKVAVKPAEPILDGRVWMQVLGGVANMKSDATNPSERSTNFGLAAGADTALTPNIRAGFALSGGQSTSKVASLATKADATWGQAALYGVATDGARYAKAALVYGYLSTETERTVTAFSTPETAKGKFGANLFSTRLEVGQKFLTGGPVNVTPFFAFEPSWLVQNGYSETGAATVALGYGKTTTRALPATLGMKFDADLALDGLRVTPSATVGWVHNFADTASLSPFFVALPGSTFTVAGAKGDRDLARTELNLEATPTGSTATFYANARADLGARTTAVRGTAGAMLRF